LQNEANGQQRKWCRIHKDIETSREKKTALLGLDLGTQRDEYGRAYVIDSKEQDEQGK
jgi:hypothetical protein